MVTDPGFPAVLQSYLKKEEIVEDALTLEEMDKVDSPDDDTE